MAWKSHTSIHLKVIPSQSHCSRTSYLKKEFQVELDGRRFQQTIFFESCDFVLQLIADIFQNHPQGTTKQNFTINLHCRSKLKNLDLNPAHPPNLWAWCNHMVCTLPRPALV